MLQSRVILSGAPADAGAESNDLYRDVATRSVDTASGYAYGRLGMTLKRG
jgi:hypothetical protein